MIEALREQIENSYYWDARVKALDCNYFGDEVKIVYEDYDGEVVYQFEECYKIIIEHSVGYQKKVSSRDLKVAQIPYFMHDVEVKEVVLEAEKYLEFKINMNPIELYIVCKKFDILSNEISP